MHSCFIHNTGMDISSRPCFVQVSLVAVCLALLGWIVIAVGFGLTTIVRRLSHTMYNYVAFLHL